MELGTGIFLSAVFLGTVGLYIATRDRWNWKKILLWPLAGLLGLGLVGGGGAYLYEHWDENRPPDPQSEFWGIKLKATMADVKFAKGEPDRTSTDDPDLWYYLPSEYSKDSIFVVKFQEGKVRYVIAVGARHEIPNIERIRGYSPLNDVVAKLGEPSYVSRSKDETARYLSFEKYRIVLRVGKNEIRGLGIYDPTLGPVRFREEAN